jgi:iron complex outermembrane receptor protein
MLEKLSKSYLRVVKTAAIACLVVLSFGARAEDDDTTEGIEEIIVTSTYRDTRLMDTPLAITAITAAEIDMRGLEDIQDLYRSVPGLSYRSQTANWHMLTIRGLSPPASGAAMVGVYFDNMPITDGSGGGLRQTLGEMFDMNRVEVLKGPQGTLYGEGSMGGSVRYITNKPDPSGLDYGFQVNVEDADFSSGLSTKVNGMVNIPIGDSLALRVVGFNRDRQGVVDTVAPASNKDVDYFEQWGVRANLTWFASDNLELSLMANITEAETGGPGIVLHCHTGPSAYSPNGSVPYYDIPGTTCPESNKTKVHSSNPYQNHFGGDYQAGGFDNQDMFNFSAEWDLSFAHLTASVSYLEREDSVAAETSPRTMQLVDPILGAFFGIPNTVSAVGSDGIVYRDSERWVQEIRLVSTSDSRWQWTAGLYNKEEDVQNGRHTGCYNGGPAVYATLPDEPCWLQWTFRTEIPMPVQTLFVPILNSVFGYGQTTFSTSSETAAYGEVTYRFNDRWEALLGVRVSEVQNDLDLATVGSDDDNDIVRSLSVKTNVTSPKFTLTWRPNDDWMVYGTVSTGFRPGITNQGLATQLAALDLLRPDDPIAEGHYSRLLDSVSVDSDEVVNYEIGVKASILDGRASFVAALYHIKWDDAIVGVSDSITGVDGILPNQFVYDSNEGEAESEGLELEVRIILSDSLNLNFGADWNWTADILTGGSGRYFGTGIEAGNRLANAPKYSGYASVIWDFTLAGFDATARADTYWSAGKYFQTTEQDLSSKNETVDVRLQIGRDQWKAALYVRNLFGHVDELERNSTGFRFGRTRTVGLQLNYQL